MRLSANVVQGVGLFLIVCCFVASNALTQRRIDRLGNRLESIEARITSESAGMPGSTLRVTINEDGTATAKLEDVP